jgi:hypothetical protein
MESSDKKPGRPPLRGEPKIRLTLSITPTTKRYLLRMKIQQAQRSVAEWIEDWTTRIAAMERPLQPLGMGSPRRGKVAARGKAINVSGECKVQLNLRVTQITKERLHRLAKESCEQGMNPSISDILDRWVMSGADLMDDGAVAGLSDA